MWTSRAFLAAAALPNLVGAEFDSCTTIGVSAGASVDGSTMTTHTSDCAQCDSRMVRIPARDWPAGTMRPIFPPHMEYPREVSNRSVSYLPVDGQAWSVPQGFIPEVPHTYAYWELVYGYMNEHGLTFGESTSAGKFVNYAATGQEAMLWIRPLTQLAMERCKTARCAIKTMGALAEEFGFYGEDPGMQGGGEVLTVADGKELWVFEITGDPTKKAAFWAAKRVPDGHIVVVGNNFVIPEIDCSDEENYLCSTDLEAKAVAAGAWDGKGKLNWMRSMAPDVREFQYVPGRDPIPLYMTARIWRVQNLAAPSLNIPLSDNPYIYPFSVPVDKKLDHRRVMDFNRDHYEGSEIDLTVGPMAGPFGNPNRIEGGNGFKITGGQYPRAISIPRTSYCTLGQSYGDDGEDDGPLDKLWFASDVPASSVFVPFYTNATGYSWSYSHGSMHKYDEGSAWWVFDFVANWMELNYGLMRVDVEAKINELQDMIDAQIPSVEKEARKLGGGNVGESVASQSVLSAFQEAIQNSVLDTWREFGRFLIMKYNDGYMNHPTVGTSIGYPAWWLETFCIDNDIHPKWAMASPQAPSIYSLFGPGPFDMPNVSDPTVFKPNTCPVGPAGGAASSQALAAEEVPAEQGSMWLAGMGASYVVVFVVGMVIGGWRQEQVSARDVPAGYMPVSDA